MSNVKKKESRGARECPGRPIALPLSGLRGAEPLRPQWRSEPTAPRSPGGGCESREIAKRSRDLLLFRKAPSGCIESFLDLGPVQLDLDSGLLLHQFLLLAAGIG